MKHLIILTRHAEEPVPDVCAGVRARGVADEASLSVRGWQRAGALAQALGPQAVAPLAAPERIHATRFSRASADTSRRSRQTVRPLAEKLGLAVDTRFGRGQERALAERLKTLSGITLVAWAHTHLSDLARALAPAAAVPKAWDDKHYDLFWIVTLDGGTATFEQRPQQLLAGDADDVPAGMKAPRRS